MRHIYLIRHGEADLGFKKGVCLGRGDVPLSHEGEKQAERLSRFFKEVEIARAYTSPLRRCKDTARVVLEKSGHGGVLLQEVEGLQEVDTGAWDGLTFEKIKKQDPLLYEKRGEHLGRTAFPGGESFLLAVERFSRAMEEILKESSSENIIVFAHAGVIRSYLCLLSGKDIDQVMDYRIPTASVTELVDTGEGVLSPKSIGLRPVEAISLSEVDRLYALCKVEAPLRGHMEAVADMAMNLIGYDISLVRADWFEKDYPFAGTRLDTRLLYYAALLHDIKRSEGGRVHPEAGAAFLEKEGYFELAAAVRLHHDPLVFKKEEPLSEAELLYYADKLVQGERMVSLQERFAKSREKCLTPEALEAHERRYQAALGIEEKVLRAL